MPDLRPHWLHEPLDHRLPVPAGARESIMAAHLRAVESGLSTYRDPSTGLTVMTATYLADRGYCCSAGCRHCPYQQG